jgi:ubiquinone/menaquinone biosynthesis C-methylase UbiE
MKTPLNYIAVNRSSWNNKTDIHLESEFYDMESFRKGKNSLNQIELELLGDVRGKTILHLQCHFGQDSISLSRMGAKVTGVDLSDKAIDNARKIAQELASDARFICCDIYELEQHLNEEFDMVFTSYGTIGWLPDLDRWASLIYRFLKPGGKLVFAEFHPVVWMFDDDFEKVAYNYFNTGAIVENESGSYADREAPIKQEYVMWNHGLGDVLSSLLNQGLQLNSFQEYDYSPYKCFKHTNELQPGRYRIQHLDNKIPMVYSLSAIKNDA